VLIDQFYPKESEAEEIGKKVPHIIPEERRKKTNFYLKEREIEKLGKNVSLFTLEK